MNKLTTMKLEYQLDHEIKHGESYYHERSAIDRL
jgi:hypothetical protein